MAAMQGAPPEALESMKDSLKKDPNFVERSISKFQGMSPGQQIGMVIGGVVAIASIANILFGGGGLLSLLGVLGGGALAASSGGLFGDKGNIMNMFGGMFGGKETPRYKVPERESVAAGALNPTLAPHLETTRGRIQEGLADKGLLERIGYHAGEGTDVARQSIYDGILDDIKRQIHESNPDLMPEQVETLAQTRFEMFPPDELQAFADEAMKGTRKGLGGGVGEQLGRLWSWAAPG
jgi:hypothetical protein